MHDLDFDLYNEPYVNRKSKCYFLFDGVSNSCLTRYHLRDIRKTLKWKSFDLDNEDRAEGGEKRDLHHSLVIDRFLLCFFEDFMLYTLTHESNINTHGTVPATEKKQIFRKGKKIKYSKKSLQILIDCANFNFQYKHSKIKFPSSQGDCAVKQDPCASSKKKPAEDIRLSLRHLVANAQQENRNEVKVQRVQTTLFDSKCLKL